MLPRLLLLSSLSFTLTACLKTTTASVETSLAHTLAPPPAVAVPDSFCSWAEPIYYSKDDTAETVAQVKVKHNVPYVALCGKPQVVEDPPH